MKILQRYKRVHATLVGGTVLLLLLCLNTSVWAIKEGEPAPDFSLTDTEGNTVTLSKLQGKVVVVNFFTIWCQPCRKEMPELNAIYKENKDKGLAMLGICLSTDPNQLKAFAKQMNLNYPILLGTDQVSKDYGDITAVPTTFVINKEGKIAVKIEGARHKEEFLKVITPLL
ncbi:MAG: TlpA family protein disulfide reductase [Deltaproteobacteria bacterium]|nr:TlpA family protein disulfide reductase [Deltaproteobacteria bacterium]